MGCYALDVDAVPFFCGLLADLPFFFFLSLALVFEFDPILTFQKRLLDLHALGVSTSLFLVAST